MTRNPAHQPSDRYAENHGDAVLTGVQALARLPIAQLRVDRVGGYHTAAFLSGYQGPPLGGLDLELNVAVEQVPDLPILLRPAVNEELGATAVMGSQLVSIQADARYEGVVGFWYGNSSGLARAGDALRHANHAGASRYGGAVALVGDDARATGSTLPASSDRALVGLRIPVFQPGDVQEVLDLGRHAVALSRLTGLWTAIRIVAPVAGAWGTAALDLDRVKPIEPNLEVDGLLHVPLVEDSLSPTGAADRADEIQSVRLEIARRYGVVNDLNRPTANPRRAWIGIVAGGHTYHEVVEALRRLGLSSLEEVEGADIRLLRLQMPFPLDRRVVRNFARGLDEVVVVEERDTSLESTVKDALYGSSAQPRIVARVDDRGRDLIPGHGLLTADELTAALYRRLRPRIGDRLAPPPQPSRTERAPVLSTGDAVRGTGDAVRGSGDAAGRGDAAGSGIGGRGITSRGAEGSQWVGMEPFLERNHFVQSLDDTTLHHSGQLAIQAAVAARSNVTYRLRYTGAAAVPRARGGLGGMEIKDLVKVLLATGVTEVLVATDDPDRYENGALPTSRHAGRTKVWDRTRIGEAQDYLATVPGVSVLISDQGPVAEARRRGTQPGTIPARTRMLIDHRICEACGGCGDIGTSRSLRVVDTPFRPKTAVAQNPDDPDLLCLEGDCPGFLTVEPGPARTADDTPRTPDPSVIAAGLQPLVDELGEPSWHLPGGAGDGPFDVRLAGVDEAGVISAARVLATAAMLDGWTVRGVNHIESTDDVGLVIGDLRFVKGRPAPSNLIGGGEARVILGFDPAAAAADAVARAGRKGRTVLVASTTGTAASEVVGPPAAPAPTEGELEDRVAAFTRPERNRLVNAGDLTRRVLGAVGPANTFLIGVAHQSGLLPFDSAAIEKAIELDGVAVETNRSAFRLGRCWVHGADGRGTAEVNRLWLDEPERGTGVDPATGGEHSLPESLSKQLLDLRLESGLHELLAMLTADLVAYQDRSYAERFVDFMTRTVGAERLVAGESTRLSEAVGRSLHKLMAYTDEYEIARLLLRPEVRAAAEELGGEGAVITWKPRPPMLRALGMNRTLSLDSWRGRPMLRLLAASRRLRGTGLDPFGRSELRRAERSLIEEYLAVMEDALHDLDDAGFDATVELADSAMEIRGFERLKLKRIADFRRRLERGVAVPAR